MTKILAVHRRVVEIQEQLSLIEKIVSGEDNHNIWQSLDHLETLVSDFRVPVAEAFERLQKSEGKSNDR